MSECCHPVRCIIDQNEVEIVSPREAASTGPSHRDSEHQSHEGSTFRQCVNVLADLPHSLSGEESPVLGSLGLNGRNSFVTLKDPFDISSSNRDVVVVTPKSSSRTRQLWSNVLDTISHPTSPANPEDDVADSDVFWSRIVSTIVQPAAAQNVEGEPKWNNGVHALEEELKRLTDEDTNQSVRHDFSMVKRRLSPILEVTDSVDGRGQISTENDEVLAQSFGRTEPYFAYGLIPVASSMMAEGKQTPGENSQVDFVSVASEATTPLPVPQVATMSKQSIRRGTVKVDAKKARSAWLSAVPNPGIFFGAGSSLLE